MERLRNTMVLWQRQQWGQWRQEQRGGGKSSSASSGGGGGSKRVPSPRSAEPQGAMPMKFWME
jgi:hypothetical protein